MGLPAKDETKTEREFIQLSFLHSGLGVQTAAAKCLFSVTQSFNTVLADYVRARKSDFTLRFLF